MTDRIELPLNEIKEMFEEGCIFTEKQLDRMYDRKKLLKEYFEFMESE